MKSTQIISALVWAAVILALSILMKDSPNFKSMFILLIGASTIQLGALSSYSRKCKTTSTKKNL